MVAGDLGGWGHFFGGWRWWWWRVLRVWKQSLRAKMAAPAWGACQVVRKRMVASIAD
jgi:hypothetical protein